MLTVLKFTEAKGRGLYAAQDLKAGTIIELCEVIVLSVRDTALLRETALKHYTFTYNAAQDCLVLGNGEIYNHSRRYNVSYMLNRVHPHEERLGMQFVLTRDVAQGEELCIDYSADVDDIDTEEYINSKSLVG